jgi:hypothetical protein
LRIEFPGGLGACLFLGSGDSRIELVEPDAQRAKDTFEYGYAGPKGPFVRHSDSFACGKTVVLG